MKITGVLAAASLALTPAAVAAQSRIDQNSLMAGPLAGRPLDGAMFPGCAPATGGVGISGPLAEDSTETLDHNAGDSAEHIAVAGRLLSGAAAIPACVAVIGGIVLIGGLVVGVLATGGSDSNNNTND